MVCRPRRRFNEERGYREQTVDTIVKKERDKVGIPMQGLEVNFQVDLGFAYGQHASNPDPGRWGNDQRVAPKCRIPDRTIIERSNGHSNINEIIKAVLGVVFSDRK